MLTSNGMTLYSRYHPKNIQKEETKWLTIGTAMVFTRHTLKNWLCRRHPLAVLPRPPAGISGPTSPCARPRGETGSASLRKQYMNNIYIYICMCVCQCSIFYHFLMCIYINTNRIKMYLLNASTFTHLFTWCIWMKQFLSSSIIIHMHMSIWGDLRGWKMSDVFTGYGIYQYVWKASSRRSDFLSSKKCYLSSKYLNKSWNT